MTVYYLDSSAWVKRYVSEGGSHLVSDLFSKNESLACSVLGLVEINATFARKSKAGNLSQADLALLTMRSRQDWQRFYHVPLRGRVIESALILARTQALRAADALHLASALLLNSFLRKRNDELVFVGADRELNAACRQLSLSVMDPLE